MLAEKFVDWLDGFLENSDPALPIGPEQTQKIRDRLNDVFHHEIDPAMVASTGQSHSALQSVHDGKPNSGVTYRC